MKGEIVIYTKTGCPYSAHTKKTLLESGMTYTEVTVDDNQQIRQYLQEETGLTSLPQVFFNGDHIGGNDKLQELRANEETWQGLLSDLMNKPPRKLLKYTSSEDSSDGKLMEMEGEIVIFTKTGCPHCLHAKQTLRDNDLAFKEILVNDNQNIKQYLKELTDKSSLPQIFFNGDNIGGNNSLQTLILDELKWAELIQDLVINHTRKVFEFTSQPESEFTCDPDKKAAIIKELMRDGIFNNCRKGIFSSKKIKSITPSAFIKWYSSSKRSVENEAETVLEDLLYKKYLLAVNNSQDLKGIIASNSLLRLNDGSDSSALNSGAANFCKLENPATLGKLLQKNLVQVFNNHVSSDGKNVNYEEMKDSPSFEEYQVLCRELQLSPIERFSEDQKKSFFINGYNAMAIHATVRNGSPDGPWGWLKLFSSAKYILGGLEYSLDDIESGILRGNKRPALGIFRPFSSSDPRKSLMLKKPDPRIHFALNCGMKDCPPLTVYSAENIDEELRVATTAYLSSDKGVRIEVGENTSVIHLSSMFKWYASDFGASPEQVMEWVMSYVVGEKKLQLVNALATKHKISYMYCDAESNASG